MEKYASLGRYTPLDKSWIIRMGLLDLVNSKKTILSFLNNQKNLSDDLLALKRVAENWSTNNPLDVGESGTLYRFVQFALWKLNKSNKVIKRGTLLSRNVCTNSDIINLPIKELLKIDNGTSQWASASVLLGNEERIANPPNKLKLTYEAVEHWKNNSPWISRQDKTIKRQAKAFINLIKTGTLNFIPEHSEDYCFARAFNLITPKEGERLFPSLAGHETNRLEEMEKAIKQAENNLPIDSKDHRVIQAVVMRQISLGKTFSVLHKEAVNKTWPQFWDFINYFQKPI